ncbi:MAG: rhomboid family intramembrane serine protease [Gemmatimonadaceae bacterium]
MSHSLTDDTEAPRLTKAVQWLIAINVAIYFLQLTVVGSSNMQLALGFEARHLSTAWWTVLSYMFVHGGFWHLALNMYTLYLFGPRVEHLWSPGEFTRYYIACGLGGWFFQLLFARDALLIGASAAVLGVMLAYAMRWPNDEVYLFGVVPIKVKWLVAILATFNLISGIAAGDQGGGVAYLAHVGGLAAGWVYLRSSSAAGFDRLRQRISQVPDVPDETPRAIPRSLPRTREKGNEVDDVISRSQAATARRPASVQQATVPAARREKADLDVLLDKISQTGIDSLTTDERRQLEERSKELRGRE